MATIFQSTLLTDFLYPFLLIFFIVFAIFRKDKYFGRRKETIECSGFFSYWFNFVGAVFPKIIVANMILFMTVGLIVIFVGLILWGFISGGNITPGKGWMKFYAWILGIAIVVAIIWASGIGSGVFNGLQKVLTFLFDSNWSGAFWSNVLFVALAAGAIAIVLKTKAKTEGKTNNLNFVFINLLWQQYFKVIFYRFSLSFLINVFIVFAVLEKTKILGEEKKQLNALVSLVVGLIFVGVVFPKVLVGNMILFLTVGMVIIFVALMLWGFISGSDKGFTVEGGTKIHKLLVFILAIAGISAVIWASGIGSEFIAILTKVFGFLFDSSWSKTFWGNALLVGLIALVVAIVLEWNPFKNSSVFMKVK